MTEIVAKWQKFPQDPRQNSSPAASFTWNAIYQPDRPPYGIRAVVNEVTAQGADDSLLGVSRYEMQPFEVILARFYSDGEANTFNVLSSKLNQLGGTVGEMTCEEWDWKSRPIKILSISAKVDPFQLYDATAEYAGRIICTATLRELPPLPDGGTVFGLT